MQRFVLLLSSFHLFLIGSMLTICLLTSSAMLQVLLGMLPNYYNHVRAYEHTLITRFFGLHSVKVAGDQKICFMVMGNILCSEL